MAMENRRRDKTAGGSGIRTANGADQLAMEAGFMDQTDKEVSCNKLPLQSMKMITNGVVYIVTALSVLLISTFNTSLENRLKGLNGLFGGFRCLRFRKLF
jgi:hypothetical protein